jgi:hypothetical protein
MGLPVYEFLRKFTIARKVPVFVAIICLCEVWTDGDIKLPCRGGPRPPFARRSVWTARPVRRSESDAAGTQREPLEFPSRESVGIVLGNRKQRMKSTAENHG